MKLDDQDVWDDVPISVSILLWDSMALIAVFLVFGFAVGYFWV